MKNVSRLCDSLLVADRKHSTAAFDDGHLFMRMIVGWRYNVGRETQATDHEFLPHDHLSLNAWFDLFKRNLAPVRVQRVHLSFVGTVHNESPMKGWSWSTDQEVTVLQT
jgi:hypothetical protein